MTLIHKDMDTDKTYNLATKRRVGATRPRPLRWGTVAVLDNSPTAQYLDYLYSSEKDEIVRREKVNKYCGFISEPQKPPEFPKYRLGSQRISQRSIDNKSHPFSDGLNYPPRNPDQNL